MALGALGRSQVSVATAADLPRRTVLLSAAVLSFVAGAFAVGALVTGFWSLELLPGGSGRGQYQRGGAEHAGLPSLVGDGEVEFDFAPVFGYVGHDGAYLVRRVH